MRSGGEKEIEGRELELERGRETEQRMLRVSLPKIFGFQFLPYLNYLIFALNYNHYASKHNNPHFTLIKELKK